jgi:hypothetical protein
MDDGEGITESLLTLSHYHVPEMQAPSIADFQNSRMHSPTLSNGGRNSALSPLPSISHCGPVGNVQCIPRVRFEFTPPHASWTVHRLQFFLATCICNNLQRLPRSHTGQNCSRLALRCLRAWSALHSTFPYPRARRLAHAFFGHKNDHDITHQTLCTKSCY